uniref:Uncharacterized protein n=1 Tax=Balaenoptera musculus TaxID=9771 RepID=A0A8C0HV52_BALMU
VGSCGCGRCGGCLGWGGGSCAPCRRSRVGCGPSCGPCCYGCPGSCCSVPAVCRHRRTWSCSPCSCGCGRAAASTRQCCRPVKVFKKGLLCSNLQS